MTPATGHEPITRGEVLEWLADDVVYAVAQLLGETQDVTDRYGPAAGADLTCGGRLTPAEVARDALLLACRVETAAATAAEQIATAAAKHAYLTAGAPLVCGICGTAIAADLQPWRTCAGLTPAGSGWTPCTWAEHVDCHDPRPGAETWDRTCTLADAERRAHADNDARDRRAGAGDFR